MAASNPPHGDADELEHLRRLYAQCKRKRRDGRGRPIPCRSQRCPCQLCRVKYRQKESAILLRSYKVRPPDYTFVLKLTDARPTCDVMMSDYLNAFTQRIRDYRKSDGVAI